MKVITNKRANVDIDYDMGSIYITVGDTEYCFENTTNGTNRICHVSWSKDNKRMVCDKHMVWAIQGRNTSVVMHYVNDRWEVITD